MGRSGVWEKHSHNTHAHTKVLTRKDKGYTIGVDKKGVEKDMLSIRTQDRMSLVPYDKQIAISKSNQFNMIFDNGDTLPLGTYATKERALEVLDEIQDISAISYVYEMPNQ